VTRPALATLALLAAAAGLLAGAAPASATAPAAGATTAGPPARWVRVSVATLWVRPGEARAVDAPSAAYPADPGTWVAGQSVMQKRWLVGRLETQALYGTKVYLLGTRGDWSHVAVAGQPTPRNRWGYPGWLPTRQLTAAEPPATVALALVTSPLLWVFDLPSLSGRVLQLSCGTSLPVVSVDDQAVEVLLVDGTHAYVRRAGVVVHKTGAAWPQPTGAQLVAQARRFLGLGYLWAGTSGYCLDCSGFIELVFRALGKTIPRDAADQATVGTRVATRGALRAGDLVFFRTTSGAIHHVGLYVGSGQMIHAPSTGSFVTTISLSAEPYRSEFAGGRRLTP
jgi:gamma-D-glutamyl-L-lysine dipeptidyl-peptidase